MVKPLLNRQRLAAALHTCGAVLALLLAAPIARLHAQSVTITGPTGSGLFGTRVVVLPNGNYVVTDPGYDNGAILDVGAVYLYNGSTNALISTLTGSSANDQVGSNGVTMLPSGNYIVASSNWDNGAATNAGAMTWGSATTGVSGAVSAANSLVGSSSNDQVGILGPTVLSSGNYVVATSNWDNGAATNAGATTWGSGTTGVSGAISAANSLVGSSSNDQVGIFGLLALPNGNYVVNSFYWDNIGAVDAGAVTWGSGTTGVSGAISAANSLVGTTASDLVGVSNVTVLSNGNYVVVSGIWDNGSIANAGAVTWGNGTIGVRGAVSAANSLVGTTPNEQVGNTGVRALANGNYVVITTGWDNGSTTDVGAVTWANGTTGLSGTISVANSLVGTTVADQLGYNGVTTLTNGNYVVGSMFWDNGSIANAGAATWCNGAASVSGVVSAANSLVGSTANDVVGNGGILALTNGNYVVRTSYWDNGAIVDAGAATWGSGTTGVSGTISAAKSLIGSTANDQVSAGATYALTNGNYVVGTRTWDNGAISDAGAVTWGSGTTGVSGAVSAANSLVGSSSNDQVGNYGVTTLPNGNYVVRSGNWDNGAISDAGAATWGSGTTGVSGAVSAANSLVGSTASDVVSASGVTALPNGSYVVVNTNWDNGALADVGAVTWGSSTGGVTGAISATNSLVGSTAGDGIGNMGVTVLANGNYVVRHQFWDNGAIANAGAVTLGNGTGGTVGSITSCNSVLGSVANQAFSLSFAYNATTDKLLVGLPAENKVVIGGGPPPAPTGAANQRAGTAGTVANLAATGTAIQWYAAASGGTALPPATLLTGGSTYYATQTVAGCESAARLAVTVADPLPVELLTFTATLAGPAAVRLAWTTASEQNSQAFEVERSPDGTTFERIGEVAAAGTSTSPTAYTLPDYQLPTGATLLYYRLRQVDRDGSFAYSPVRTVALSGKAPLALFPNPAHAAATLVGAAPGTPVQVLDGLGRPVATAPADATGTAALTLPANTAPGVYVVRAGTQALSLSVE